MKLTEAIENAKSKGKKRKFNQSIDLVINFTRIDFSKPDNRLKMDLVLPKGRGKRAKVAIIAQKPTDDMKKAASVVIDAAELEKLGADKKEAKRVAKSTDYFLAEPAMMVPVAKNIGQVLGPKGKMPKPLPPNAPIDKIITNLSDTITIKNKGKFLPTIHTPIGTEEMDNKDIEENITFVYKKVLESLPNKEGNIRSIYIKTTMGPVTKVEMK